MSTRGRPSHSHVRRLRAPPLKTRAATDVESAKTPLADANQLIASFRVRAYSEARRRQREAGAPAAAAHWSQVSNLIARRAGERGGDESSARTESDGDVAYGAEALGARAPVRLFEVDPVDELERILAVRPQRFRLPVLQRRRRSRPGRPYRNRNPSRRRLRRDPRGRHDELAAASDRPAPARSGGAGNLRAAQGRSAIICFAGQQSLRPALSRQSRKPATSRALPQITAFAKGSREPPPPANPRRSLPKSGSAVRSSPSLRA
jgi:hypothetical protein